MTAIKEAAADFLSHRRVAVTGVSRTKDHASNALYKRLRGCGYEVFAVNSESRASRDRRRRTAGNEE